MIKFLLYLLLASIIATAQVPKLSFEHLTLKDGIPSNDAWCATKDKKGFLWVGTGKGICRYDGYQFQNFQNFKVGYCSGISTDTAGNIYASIASNGLGKIDLKSQTISTVFENNYADADLDNNHYENVFIDSQNQIWMSDLRQVKRHDIKSKKLHLYPLSPSPMANQIAHFYEDINKNLWIISEVGLYLFDRKNDKVVCMIGKDAVNIKNKIPMRLYNGYADAAGYLWLASHDNGLIKYNIKNNEFTFFTKGIENQNVTCVQQSVDENGSEILLAGTKNGLSIFYPKQNKFYNLPEFYEKGIHIRSFFDDLENGILWILTREGIYKYHYRNIGIRTINLPTNIIKLPVGVMTFLQITNDEYLLGLSHTGILKWKASNNQFELYKYPISAYTYKIRKFQNQVFAFTDKGVFSLNGKVFSIISQFSKGFTSAEFVDGIQDKKGRFWIANLTEGIKVFDQKTKREIKLWSDQTHHKTFKNNYLKGIEQDSENKIWISTCPSSLIIFDEIKSEFISVKDLASNKNKAMGGLCNNALHINNDNSVLVASWGGINKISSNGTIQNTFDYEQDKLADSYCGNICEDNYGNLWFSSNEGIQIANQKTRSIKRITSVEGLYSNTIFGFLKNTQNELLLGFNNVFNLLNINTFIASKTIPKIEISSVEIYGKTILQDYSKEIVLSPNENSITLNFSTLNYEPKSKNIYKYQLEGFNNSWVDMDSKNSVSFTNLDPKTYTLKVKAGNTTGIWNEKPLTINLKILPFYNETLWFKFLMAFLAIGLLFGFLRWRLNTISEKNQLTLQMTELKLKALQSQMNPHFIFNSLNSIQNYIMQQKPIEAARYLSKFSKLMRRILDQSFNNLTPLSEIVETLKMYMELEAFRFSNEFTWDIKLDDEESIADVNLPPLLLQPYVENAIIHGLMPKEGDKKLLIHLYKFKNELHCVVDDNGVGRGNKLTGNNDHISRGQKLTTDMLATMKQLLHADAQIEITDKKGADKEPIGTKVDLIIPLT